MKNAPLTQTADACFETEDHPALVDRITACNHMINNRPFGIWSNLATIRAVIVMRHEPGLTRNQILLCVWGINGGRPHPESSQVRPSETMRPHIHGEQRPQRSDERTYLVSRAPRTSQVSDRRPKVKNQSRLHCSALGFSPLRKMNDSVTRGPV